MDNLDLIRAVDLAAAGDRARASRSIDPDTNNPTACWILGCLRKLDGDEPSARRWYARSGQFYESYSDGRAELAAIKAALTY